MCGKRAHNRFFMKYMHAIGQHNDFIGERSVAGADVQPGGQVENRFAGMPGVRRKKNI